MMTYAQLVGLVTGIIITCLILIAVVFKTPTILSKVVGFIPLLANTQQDSGDTGKTPLLELSNHYDLAPEAYTRRNFVNNEVEEVSQITMKGSEDFRAYLQEVLDLIGKDRAAYNLVTSQIVSLEEVDANDFNNVYFGVNDRLGQGAGVLTYPLGLKTANPGFAEFMKGKIAAELVLHAEISRLAQQGKPEIRQHISEDLKQSNEAAWRQYTLAKNKGKLEAMQTVNSFISNAKLPHAVQTIFTNRIEAINTTLSKLNQSSSS